MSTNQHIDQTFDEFNEANQYLYGEGFIDGVEDTFNRVIKLIKSNFKTRMLPENKEVIEYKDNLLERLDKLKNRT